MSTLLNSLAQKFGTDKSSDIHNYCNKYSKFLPFKRYDNLNIMEIGVLDGKSLLTWQEYFYKSNILGIDINPDCKQYEDKENRITVEIGSQADHVFLNDIMREYAPFDMILDDGSHMNEHVIFSFEHLFQSVKSGGLYVIEDIGTSYWSDYGGGLREPQTSIEYFKKLVDDINFRGILNFNQSNVHARREDWCEENIKNEQPDCVTDIESINFLNGIIIITKR